jgi:hypothetical protein
VTTGLGLLGVVVFIAGTIALAAAVTYLVIKLFPLTGDKKPKDPKPDPEPAAE